MQTINLFPDLSIKDGEVQHAVLDVLESGRYIGGEYVAEFAGMWAAYCGAEYCVPVASGSAALTTALKAMLLPANTQVLLPALSFAATAFSVLEAGYKVLYCDVGKDGQLDQDLCLSAVNNLRSMVRVVVPVYLYGKYVELREELLLRSDVFVVEDACQAHGMLREVQGDAACFSFYPSKNLGAAGDAGAVVTNVTALADYVEMYINYGDPPGCRYVHRVHGTNARMDNIQAAILCHKLAGLESTNITRASIARDYDSLGIHSLVSGGSCSWHLYPVLVDKPDRFKSLMGQAGVQTGRYYPYVLPDVVEGTIYGSISNARFISQHVVTLPIGPHVTPEMVKRVADVFMSCVDGKVVDNESWEVWKVKDGE